MKPVKRTDADDDLAKIQADADALKHKREVAGLKAECVRLTAENNSLLKHLEEAEKRASFIDSIDRDDIIAKALARLKPSGKGTAVINWSDWHVEENVDPTTVNGLNKFNPAIAEKRVQQMARRVVMLIDSLAAKLVTITDLVFALSGDFINGYLIEEMEEDNHLSPTEATLFAEDLIYTGIQHIRKETGISDTVLVTSWGNHSRTNKRKRISTGYKNSYEWLMYKQMEKYSRRSNDGLLWKIENGYHNWLTIQGFDCRFHHGDAINYWGGVGGITIPVNKAISQWNKVRTAHYDFFGHFHQSINMNRWICNGSVVGFNPFALSIKAEYEAPSQTLAVITKKRGMIAALPAFCD